MKFSITHPLAAGECDPAFLEPANLVRFAQAVESAGFAGLAFTDHPAPSQKWLDAGGHQALDPFVALGFMAAATQTLRLMPNIVVLPYRNPFITAKGGATVDVLSGGRFTLAVGTGYLKSEFRALGVDFDERNDLVDEALEVIRAIWTTDDLDYEGRRFSARGISSHPRPIQQPHPPIWIGGNGARARQRVCDHGAGWNPFPAPAWLARTSRTVAMETPDDLARGLDDLRSRLDRAGRSHHDVDVAFANPAGGDPASADFDVDTHLEGLDALAELGVTWTGVSVPGANWNSALDVVARYGETVIAGHGG
ncbi:MAG: LLM class F420-dependent oxidoreductase [Acidimicrobiales bacterium]